MSMTDKIASVVLWPGNKVCDLLKIEGEDHRLILRLWANLIIYGILSLSIMMLVME